MELKDFKSYQALLNKDCDLAAKVNSVYNLVAPLLNGISKDYKNYTMHDINHSLRVLLYMEQLAWGIDHRIDEKIEQFNALELAMMILSALFHDIGMFIRDKDPNEIKENRFKYLKFTTYEGVLKIKESEEEAIKEIIRLTHAPRVKDFIYDEYKIDGQERRLADLLKVNDSYSYADDLIAICQAHGEDYKYLRELDSEMTKGVYTYNPKHIAALLRIADYLDLDKQRTPILWFSLMGIEGFSRSEWENHFQIENEKKLKVYNDEKMQIFFSGKSSNAKIHRKYLKYIDSLKIELENAEELLNTNEAKEKYKLNIITKIDDRVKTIGFECSDLRLNLDYTAITELLMGENIYGDCRLGLRELIQNSIDACKVMREIKERNPDILIPIQIAIIYSAKNNYVKIKDSGTGMSLDIVKKHFLNVGKSYYKSNEYIFENHKYKPIGQYGIGFLACFLLSDNVIVKTKHYSNNEINQIELEKNSEYVVTNTESTPSFYGTEIILDYKKFFEVFKSVDNLKTFLSKYFNSDIPLLIRNEDENEPYTQINNCCEKEVEIMLQRHEKATFERYNCADYSKKMIGKLILKYNKQRAAENVDLSHKKIFIYQPERKRFEKVESVRNGYYSVFEYSLMPIDNYEKICQGRKNIDERKAAILGHSREEGLDIILLIDSKDKVNLIYFEYEDEDDDTVNSEKIFGDSGLNYYKELLTYQSRQFVFVDNNLYTNLELFIFDSVSHGRYYSRGYNEPEEFSLYNKDILVRDFPGIDIRLPYEFEKCEGYGYINYFGNDLKLNVSRNEIIEGNAILRKEIILTLLKAKLEKETNTITTKFLKSMIEYEELEEKK